MALYPAKIDQEKEQESKGINFAFEKKSSEGLAEKKFEGEKVFEKKEATAGREETFKPVIREKEAVAEPQIIPQKITTAIFKSPTKRKIESIMEEDLAPVYQKMTTLQKKKFKEQGEVTASKIEQLLSAVKVKAKEILGAIRGWLKLIPGVNKFFLEQEAKIKADKILKIKQKE